MEVLPLVPCQMNLVGTTPEGSTKLNPFSKAPTSSQTRKKPIYVRFSSHRTPQSSLQQQAEEFDRVAKDYVRQAPAKRFGRKSTRRIGGRQHPPLDVLVDLAKRHANPFATISVDDCSRLGRSVTEFRKLYESVFGPDSDRDHQRRPAFRQATQIER